ncbi:MAG: dTDP-glucose 4,6-dehydratase [Armatimonadetes bacterium]|nr:dTDP-glucose 4,6-dehydratase [Armatimonadota bacterium]
MKYLVTGGAGFIGSNFVHFLLSRDSTCEVVVLDALTYAGNLENLDDLKGNPRFSFIHGDVRDREAVAGSLEGVEGVFHFAAETHVDRSILGSSEFITTNVLGTHTLLEGCRTRGIRRFLHVGTDEVYGSAEEVGFPETAVLAPSSPYSASKAAADLLALAYHKTYQLPVVVTRSSNNFGPYQFPEKMIPLFVTQAAENRPLPVYGDGMQKRDWLYVEDNCEAIWTVYEKGEIGTIYNVGTGTVLTNLALTREILRLLGKSETLIRHVEDRPGHDRCYLLDCTRLFRLGWAPRQSFSEALFGTIEWYKTHEAWWKGIKEKKASFQQYYEAQYGKRGV